MQEVKIENGSTSDSINPKEGNKKRTILRAKTMTRRRENRIVRKQSEEPFRRMVSFADKDNKPIHTVIEIAPFKYEAEYIKAVENSPGPVKKSQGCHCLIF
jgi:hypothetical protein